MKLALMSYTFSRQGWQKNGKFDWEGMCRVGRELKIDGADIVGLGDSSSKDVKRMLADYGIAPVCYTFIPELNFPTAAERRAGVDQVKAGVEIAAALGAPVIMVVTINRQVLPRDVSRRNFIAGLQESAEFARQAGVVVSVENFPGAASPFVVSSDFLEAAREVPGLKLTYDNGNVVTGGEDPAVSFARCGAYVAHAHFKDWVLATEPGKGLEGLDGRYYTPALIGEGLVPQRLCLEAMKQAGYKGYINIEYEGDKFPPDEATRRAAGYLQNLIEGL